MDESSLKISGLDFHYLVQLNNCNVWGKNCQLIEISIKATNFYFPTMLLLVGLDILVVKLTEDMQFGACNSFAIAKLFWWHHFLANSAYPLVKVSQLFNSAATGNMWCFFQFYQIIRILRFYNFFTINSRLKKGLLHLLQDPKD